MSSLRSSRIGEFAVAFGRNWLVLMSGAFTVPFAALAVFADSSASRTIWAAMALSMMLLATYLMWLNEHKEVVRLTNELVSLRSENKNIKDDGVPNIERSTATIVIGSTRQNERDYVSIALNVSLKNTGAASALEKWGLQFVVDDVAFDGYLLQPRLLELHSAKGAVRITAADLIENKATLPIPKGGILRGWLVAALPDLISYNEATSKGNKINIFYADVFGKGHTIRDIDIGEVASGFYSLPDANSGLQVTLT